MMQDLPKLFRPEHAVGVAMTELWTAFNPVKNSIKDALDKQKNNIACECAATAEFGMFQRACDHICCPVFAVLYSYL